MLFPVPGCGSWDHVDDPFDVEGVGADVGASGVEAADDEEDGGSLPAGV